jgi:hypothetical protein
MALLVLPGARLSESLFSERAPLRPGASAGWGVVVGQAPTASPEVNARRPPLRPRGASTQTLCLASPGREGRRRRSDRNSNRTEPQIRRDYPPNLSISISGGRETNEDSLSNGERSGNSSSLKSLAVAVRELWPGEATGRRATLSKLTWKGASERVRAPFAAPSTGAVVAFGESGCLGMQPKVGGRLHLKLNTGTRPIANKYREGKVKSTLKRESKRPRNR